MCDAFQRPDAFTFIVTYGRSGSTLLQNLLNTIPGYQIRGENNNALLHLAQSVHAVRTQEQLLNRRKTGQPTEPTDPWFGGELVFPEEYGKALADAFIQTVLKPGPGVRVAGFKEIRFHTEPQYFWIYLNFIFENFPNVRFVFNTRQHQDVAQSGWWADQEPVEVILTLQRAEKLFIEYQKSFPERCHRVHYDDYVADPQTLRPLFSFLDEEWDAKMVDWVMNTRLDHLR
jgi:hypothetical protein